MPDSDEQIREQQLRDLDGEIYTVEGDLRKYRENVAIAEERLEELQRKRDALGRKI